ncbi:MAG TPA: HNH endonuclease signature motif containing protein [Candidatus Paceibacterota bacterium]|nr:HNH endonuclease signature motif containing protein [Candidatus Paceibacterota bacterium]
MQFEYPEDREFFANLLTDGDQKKLSKFKDYFDFRSPKVKREEYNLMRDALFQKIIKRDGYVCRLTISPRCLRDRELQIDHVIPLSTNIINKTTRRMKALPGKKVAAQSFGSNYLGNLIFACRECNREKWHRFLDRETLQRVLKSI